MTNEEFVEMLRTEGPDEIRELIKEADAEHGVEESTRRMIGAITAGQLSAIGVQVPYDKETGFQI